MPQPADMIGRTLARTYQIERLLGGGGMGAVYAARHVRTGGMFAVKVLHRETASDAEIYKRFQDEARTVSALRHPHIVQVTDFDADEDGAPFIVMELLEGEDLYQRLCTVGKLPLDQVLDIGRQVGSALHAAHERGVIHRDIKPQNIFLVRHELADITTEVAKVVDFGISKIRRAGGQMTRDMTILGTPQFMSPEAALGQNSQLDGRADQWSLGVIMYLSLSGRLPFDGENLVGVLYMVVHEQPTPLKELCPDVPDHVINAVARAMSKKKDDRFPRMADFVRAITGHGQTVGAQMRFTSGMQMNSAVMRVPTGADLAAASGSALPALPAAPQPLQLPPASALAPDAPTKIPHLDMMGKAPAGYPPSTPSAATRVPYLDAAVGAAPSAATQPPVNPDGVRTIPAINPVLGGDMMPLTVPVGQAPAELVGTPTSPTAMAPFPQEATRVNAKSPPPPGSKDAGASSGDGVAKRPASGNTPTSISMSSSAFDSLLQDSSKTPVKEPLSLPGSDFTIDKEGDPGDLQGVPTRVAVNPGSTGQVPAVSGNATLPFMGMARNDPFVPPVGMNATIPLGNLKRNTPGSAMDSAYPSTLSRATGEQAVSSSSRAALGVNLLQIRDRAFALTGITPREPKRLAIAGGVLAAMVFVVLLLILLGGGSKPVGPAADKPVSATSQDHVGDSNNGKPGPTDKPDSPGPGDAPDQPPEKGGDPGDAKGKDPAPSDDAAKGSDTKKPKATPAPPPRKPMGNSGGAPKKKPKLF